MRIDLSDKHALVSGSSAGIGFAVARGLAACGATVVLHGRSMASVCRARETLLAAQPDARLHVVAADLSDAAGAQALLAALPVAVDILVNNAGIYRTEDFFEADDEVWEKHWQINVMSGVRLSRALVQGMVSRGWGRVVFISSESARNIPPPMIHYGVSKTAQLALARGLAKRVAGTGVTVNSVLPGPTKSEGVVARMKGPAEQAGLSIDEQFQRFVLENRPSSVIRRAASVDEVANMVVYACSKQASATTGAALRVDGGIVDDIV
ncbi:MAG: SDR family oxidoreductase [Burkholderiaceae bacterium]